MGVLFGLNPFLVRGKEGGLESRGKRLKAPSENSSG